MYLPWQRDGVGTALAAKDFATVAAVMTPPDDGEDGLAGHAVRCGFIWDPSRRLSGLELECVGIGALHVHRKVVVVLNLLGQRKRNC